MLIEGKEVWDKHWSKLENTKLSKILTFFRKSIIANDVKYNINRYFPKNGIFVEAGSGTSETSEKIKKEFIALDFSYEALKLNKNKNRLCANIFNLPFKNSSINSIWNLGVMEHFSLEEINEILNEFSRVLKKDGIFIAFWPSKFGPVNIITFTIELLLKIFKIKYKFFPNELSLLKSKQWLENIINKNNNFKLVKFKLGVRSLFIYQVIILSKK